jgi:hypothetical protein
MNDDDSCALCAEPATDERAGVRYCFGHLLLTLMLAQPVHVREAS